MHGPSKISGQANFETSPPRLNTTSTTTFNPRRITDKMRIETCMYSACVTYINTDNRDQATFVAHLCGLYKEPLSLSIKSLTIII